MRDANSFALLSFISIELLCYTVVYIMDSGARSFLGFTIEIDVLGIF